MSKKKDTYLDDLEEWQEHQYDPGYYTGSRMPPVNKHNGKLVRMAILYFIPAGAFALFYIVQIVQTINGNMIGSWGDRELSIFQNILLETAFFGLPFLACVLLGIVFLRKAKRKEAERKKIVHSRERKKSRHH